MNGVYMSNQTPATYALVAKFRSDVSDAAKEAYEKALRANYVGGLCLFASDSPVSITLHVQQVAKQYPDMYSALDLLYVVRITDFIDLNRRGVTH